MEYLIARTVNEALGMTSGGRPARYVAGGTDLAVQLAGGSTLPEALVDVSGIPELLRLERGPSGLVVGAAVTIERLAAADGLPVCLVQGARSIGSPQVRALATLGGNLCNASPCGDCLAPVVVLGGRLVLASPAGRREVPAEEFFTGPKATVLRAGELLVEVLFGAEALEGRSALPGKTKHGVRAFTFEGFLHFYIPAFFQLAHVSRQVAPGHPGLIHQEGKIGSVDDIQHSH
jgi:carbon-monoxide dehydrogenase medium subunit